MKVLLADDDPVSLKVLKLALLPEGYEISSASSGSQAWEYCESEEALSVAVIDWMMPDIDGISLCRRIRELDRRRRRHTHVILVTARGHTEDIVAGLQAGADDYLVKPLNPSELRARVLVGKRIVELQNELIERNQMLEDYNAAVSHDLKTPLIAVKMTLEQVMGLLYGDIDPAAVTVLRRARESVDDLLGMCQTMLELARMSRTESPSSAVVDLVSVARSAARDLQPLMEQQRKNLNIVVEDGCESCRVMAVPSEMKSLLMNLADNAVKFAADNSIIVISFSCRDSVARVAIENCGDEIPEQTRKALFVRFSEIAGGGAQPGTGLGLYLCRRIVEGHGGKIWYEHHNGRSKFVFELELKS